MVCGIVGSNTGGVGRQLEGLDILQESGQNNGGQRSHKPFVTYL